MNAVGARMRQLHHDLAAEAPRAADGVFAEDPAVFRAQARLPQLHQLQPLLEALLELVQHDSGTVTTRVGDCVLVWKSERSKDRRVRGQHRRHHAAVDLLPCDRLILARMRFVFPTNYPIEMQPHGGVRIGVDASDPGVRGLDIDAELLVQLAR